jgi:hypothetical protein
MLKYINPVYTKTYNGDLYNIIKEVTERNNKYSLQNRKLTKSEELDSLFGFTTTPVKRKTKTQPFNIYKTYHKTKTEKDEYLYVEDKLGLYSRTIKIPILNKNPNKRIPCIVDFDSQLDRKNYSMLRNNKIMTIQYLKKNIVARKDELDLFQDRMKFKLYGSININNEEKISDIVERAKYLLTM